MSSNELTGDIDGDGVAETIENDGENTRVLRLGALVWESPSPLQGVGGSWKRSSSDIMVVGDVDGDGLAEVVIANNGDLWTGVLKWQGGGLRPVWMSPSPLSGPAGSWTRGPDELAIVSSSAAPTAVAVALDGPNNTHCLLHWQAGALRPSAIAASPSAAGDEVYKFTYLLDLVDITGTVMPIEHRCWMPGCFNLRADSNFAHLTDAVPGSANVIHCETYPDGIAFLASPPGIQQINKYAPWGIPDVAPGLTTTKVWDFSGTVPTSRAMQVGDRVMLRGRLVIENGHPIRNGVAQDNGGHGWVFLELHPFDFNDVRLVTVPKPTDVVRETLILAAPLYGYVWPGGGSATTWIRANGALFHNAVRATLQILAPAPPPGINPQTTAVSYRETVIRNGTGLGLDSLRQVTHIEGGIEVEATVHAPPVRNVGAAAIADANDPANGRSILQVQYEVAWSPITGGLLRHTIRDQSQWQPWGDVNAQIGDVASVTAVAAASATAGEAQFLLISNDGRIWHTIRKANGWAHAGDVLGQVGGYFGHVIAVAATSAAPGSSEFLFATNSGELRHAMRVSNTAWTPIDRLYSTHGVGPHAPLPTPFASPGRVVSIAAASAELGKAQFMMATDDGRLWHTIRESPTAGQTNWQPAYDVEAQIGNIGKAASVAAASAAAGELQFMVATADGRVWHTIRSAVGPWQTAYEVATQIGKVGPVVAVAATSADAGDAQFFLATADGQLWHTIRSSSGHWQPAGLVDSQIGSVGRPGRLAAVSAGAGDAQLLVATAD